MVVGDFTWARAPRILFGAGTRARLGPIVAALGRSAAVVTGARSLKESGRLDSVLQELARSEVRGRTYSVGHEPTPSFVDEVVADARRHGTEVVVAIGGGSVLDAGKAIAAMLPQEHAVAEYLEGVGTRTHDGRKVPFVAVPTTAGTGSEATVNAVLSEVGPDGYKASLRHENLAPDVALVDPELMLSCPPEVTAACGMDAFTQLLEAYVSTRASAMSDALAYDGLVAARAHLLAAYRCGSDLAARTGVAYASLLSGLALANAGLGVVHGLAGVIGGLLDVPHGVVCGTLVAAATRMSIAKLQNAGGPGLAKYAAVGRLFGARSDDPAVCCAALVEALARWTEELRLPRLGAYGLTPAGIEAIVGRASNKNNPVALDAMELKTLLLERM